MTDCYKTNKEVMADYEKKALKYTELKNKIKQEIKRHRTAVEATEDESYKLAHSMAADFLEELEEVI